jgi:hypothetical protein
MHFITQAKYENNTPVNVHQVHFKMHTFVIDTNSELRQRPMPDCTGPDLQQPTMDQTVDVAFDHRVQRIVQSKY